MVRCLSITVASAFVALVSAHFTLDYPLTRGFDENKEPEFCGGFPVSNNRTLFPLSGGMIEIDSHHDSSQFVTLISFSQNPQNFSDFNTTSSGQAVPYLKNYIQLSGTGEMCVPVDVAALGINGVQNGTNATIMVQFNGGDGTLYQCSDVTLSTDANIAIRPCTNTSTFVAIQSSTPSGSTTASAGSSTSMSKSSGLQLSPVTTHWAVLGAIIFSLL